MCNHKNNEVWTFSDFDKVTGINWKQVFGHFFSHNSTLVIYENYIGTPSCYHKL
jgi:hypothetical protein